uniref:Oxidoreductase n=1 Tax=Caenorhabditis tropicalis TaxID=1561998 RepID=A0A1I7U5E1_9PELO
MPPKQQRIDLSSFFFNPKDSQLPQKPRTRGQSGYVLHGKFGRGNWNPLSAEQKQEWNQIHHLIGVIQVEQANAGFIRVLEGNQNL